MRFKKKKKASIPEGRKSKIINSGEAERDQELSIHCGSKFRVVMQNLFANSSLLVCFDCFLLIITAGSTNLSHQSRVP